MLGYLLTWLLGYLFTYLLTWLVGWLLTYLLTYLVGLFIICSSLPRPESSVRAHADRKLRLMADFPPTTTVLP